LESPEHSFVSANKIIFAGVALSFVGFVVLDTSHPPKDYAGGSTAAYYAGMSLMSVGWLLCIAGLSKAAYEFIKK
jgi:hypothetical protein